MTNDEADLIVLGKANEKGKFAIPVYAPMPEQIQFAFERGLEEEWYRFVDLSALASVPAAGLTRVFLLTSKGHARLAALRDNE
jgi:hypothetical protein